MQFLPTEKTLFRVGLAYAYPSAVKFVAHTEKRHGVDYFTTSIVPHHTPQSRFCSRDGLLLAAVTLGTAVLMRLLLAN